MYPLFAYTAAASLVSAAVIAAIALYQTIKGASAAAYVFGLVSLVAYAGYELLSRLAVRAARQDLRDPALTPATAARLRAVVARHDRALARSQQHAQERAIARLARRKVHEARIAALRGDGDAQ